MQRKHILVFIDIFEFYYRSTNIVDRTNKTNSYFNKKMYPLFFKDLFEACMHYQGKPSILYRALFSLLDNLHRIIIEKDISLDDDAISTHLSSAFQAASSNLGNTGHIYTVLFTTLTTFLKVYDGNIDVFFKNHLQNLHLDQRYGQLDPTIIYVRGHGCVPSTGTFNIDPNIPIQVHDTFGCKTMVPVNSTRNKLYTSTPSIYTNFIKNPIITFVTCPNDYLIYDVISSLSLGNNVLKWNYELTHDPSLPPELRRRVIFKKYRTFTLKTCNISLKHIYKFFTSTKFSPLAAAPTVSSVTLLGCCLHRTSITPMSSNFHTISFVPFNHQNSNRKSTGVTGKNENHLASSSRPNGLKMFASNWKKLLHTNQFKTVRNTHTLKSIFSHGVFKSGQPIKGYYFISNTNSLVTNIVPTTSNIENKIIKDSFLKTRAHTLNKSKINFIPKSSVHKYIYPLFKNGKFAPMNKKLLNNPHKFEKQFMINPINKTRLKSIANNFDKMGESIDRSQLNLFMKHMHNQRSNIRGTYIGYTGKNKYPFHTNENKSNKVIESLLQKHFTNVTFVKKNVVHNLVQNVLKKATAPPTK